MQSFVVSYHKAPTPLYPALPCFTLQDRGCPQAKSIMQRPPEAKHGARYVGYKAASAIRSTYWADYFIALPGLDLPR